MLLSVCRAWQPKVQPRPMCHADLSGAAVPPIPPPQPGPAVNIPIIKPQLSDAIYLLSGTSLARVWVARGAGLGWQGPSVPSCPDPGAAHTGTMACKNRLWAVPVPLRAQPGASTPGTAPTDGNNNPNPSSPLSSSSHPCFSPGCGSRGWGRGQEAADACGWIWV